MFDAIPVLIISGLALLLLLLFLYLLSRVLLDYRRRLYLVKQSGRPSVTDSRGLTDVVELSYLLQKFSYIDLNGEEKSNEDIERFFLLTSRIRIDGKPTFAKIASDAAALLRKSNDAEVKESAADQYSSLNDKLVLGARSDN
ncbi:hypothetical protein AAD018_003210 [Aestuariibius insulae]|uniref:hypothetical protein n=1 Tax=Aestuariibius insulae TaxID=2058287 RepID=UPI00398E538D